jgi:hypothetical protein
MSGGTCDFQPAVSCFRPINSGYNVRSDPVTSLSISGALQLRRVDLEKGPRTDRGYLVEFEVSSVDAIRL